LRHIVYSYTDTQYNIYMTQSKIYTFAIRTRSDFNIIWATTKLGDIAASQISLSISYSIVVWTTSKSIRLNA